MIDALLYAVRDTVRAANIGYGYADCTINDDGKPVPRCGNWFVSVHGGRTRPGAANDRNLHEVYDFSVTLTGRVVATSMDGLGENMIARNVPLRSVADVPLAQRQGFNARVEQLRGLLHMNWRATVLVGQVPPSANDNLAAWATGTVYGFVEPARYQGAEVPVLVGGDWMGAEPDSEDFAVKSELRFSQAKRFQPQTAATGVFT